MLYDQISIKVVLVGSVFEYMRGELFVGIVEVVLQGISVAIGIV